MTIRIDELGSLLDVAQALGIVRGGSFNADWFSHPDTYVNQMLRAADQRDALIRALDALFMRDDDVSTDANGRKWVGVARTQTASFYAVIHAVGAGKTEIGVGARLATRTPGPESAVVVYGWTRRAGTRSRTFSGCASTS